MLSGAPRSSLVPKQYSSHVGEVKRLVMLRSGNHVSAIQSNPKITSEGRPLCSILAERKPESTCITSALPFHENVLK